MTNEEVARKAVTTALKFVAAKMVVTLILGKVIKGMKSP